MKYKDYIITTGWKLGFGKYKTLCKAYKYIIVIGFLHIRKQLPNHD